MVQFGLGNTNAAEQLLRTAIEDRDPVLLIINIDPAWASYRSTCVSDFLKSVDLHS